MTGTDAMAPAFAALFKTTTFSIDLQCDAVVIHRDSANVTA